ncbi:MAG: guanylate kinase [Proteobacteria bacterium]|nr:guanylate kinase [Pseudomonadota bacterium]
MQVPVTRRGLMLVLSSPSGAGKTTISRRLLEEDDNLTLSVSVTTRPRRPSETDGVDYRFIEKQAFDRMVAHGELMEHAMVFGHYYGTPREEVEAALALGRDIMFDVDWQGAQQLGEAARADLVTIFILPPSTEELERRLKARAQDPPEVVVARMSRAADEMSHWSEYDYIVINDDLEESVRRVCAVLAAERLRRYRQIGLNDFIKRMRAGR